MHFALRKHPGLFTIAHLAGGYFYLCNSSRWEGRYSSRFSSV